MTLPPAGMAIIYVSSTLSLPALETLGVWSWLLEAAPAAERANLTKAALAGLLWMLTPYRVLRLVHAVRKPLEAPAFRAPVVEPRAYGAVQATFARRLVPHERRVDGEHRRRSDVDGSA